MSKFKPTEEQQAYLEAGGGDDNIALEALAGTGKTATACLFGEHYPNKRIRIAVFNNRNAKEMNERLPSNMDGSTFHSMCGKWFGSRRPRLMAGNACPGHKAKVPQLILKSFPEFDYTKIKRDDPENRIMYDNVSALTEIVSKMKSSFITIPSVEEVKALAEFHQIEYLMSPDDFATNALKILAVSDSDRSTMDFDDMIRFHVLDQKVFSDSDIFIGDEFQDSTPVRIEIVRLLSQKGTKVHIMGDQNQGIYVFTGASINSFTDSIEALNSTIMPLTVNFRCSKAVIMEAQKLVPDIKNWDGAPEGEVRELTDSSEFATLFQPGDCAIARFNKVIIPSVFKLLRQGKKATIQGADFGKQIVKIIKSVRAQDMEDFNSKLSKMEERDYSKCTTEFGQSIIEDKYATIAYFADNSNTVSEMITLVESLFSDKSISPYMFSTGHKSKGLEWPNVFILDHKNFRAPQAKLPWQFECEKRLEYVAKTRAKLNMYYA
jgi:superfamily I DNA/RNA helicase